MALLMFVVAGAALIKILIPTVFVLSLALVVAPGKSGWRHRLWLLPMMAPTAVAMLCLAFPQSIDPSTIGAILTTLAWGSLAAAPVAFVLLPRVRWRALICGIANVIPPWILLFIMTAVGGLSHPPGP